jgi:DNA-binding NarL/FixJ family response regulator
MPSLNKIKIAVVDDHQIVIDGITALLKGNAHITIIATSTSSINILKALENIEIDLLLTDVMMPEMNGLELSKKVKEQFPTIKILALSMNGQGSVINQMINDADISGYVMKNIGKQELINAIEKIAAGGIYFTEEILDELEKFSHIKKENEEAHLTTREVEIIKLVEKELSNKQIADALFISERTVETHRKNIFRKTNTNSVLGLIKYAYQHKLIVE